MLTGIKVATIFTAIAAATVTAFASVHAAPLPLNIFHEVNGDDLGSYRLVNINIPTEDTTQPVYGGVVRYYDVAIAQAIAISYKLCPSRNSKGIDFYLTAGNQAQIDMGKFFISCNLAHDLVAAYGLNEDVVRPSRNPPGIETYYMPSLNLNTDAKARRFVSFSSNFKPVNR
jgi:serine/threonine-protein kinase